MRKNNQPIKGTDESLKFVTDSREFRRCSPQQKTFVLDFLKTGDSQHAVELAYPSANAKSHRALKYQVIKSQAVADVLEAWAWRDTEHAHAHLIEIIRDQLLAADPGSTAASTFAVQLERLVVGLKGTNKAHFQDPDDDIDEPEPQPQPPETGTVFFVGQKVTERDSAGVLHVGIVRALDANGRPSKIEEVKS